MATPNKKSSLYFDVPNVTNPDMSKLATPKPDMYTISYDPNSKKWNSKLEQLQKKKNATTNDKNTLQWADKQSSIYTTKTTNKNGKITEEGNLGDHTLKNITIDVIMKKLHKTLNLQTADETVNSTFKKTMNQYNRFKVPLPNSMLSAAYPHVFFVKPNCHIYNKKNELTKGLSANAMFSNALTSVTNKKMLDELCCDNGSNTFMLSLSNAARSFTPQDEFINDGEYGRGYTGYKISYGQSNVESRTSGKFNVEFLDDRNLHIYQTNKLWMEYISSVFRGNIMPRMYDIKHKILDYVGAVYYILTAEDNETIIFWTKYYGVFPTTSPASQFTWGGNTKIYGDVATRYDVTYKFSMKIDYDPHIFAEFNYNANINPTSAVYEPTYDAQLGHAGTTWVKTPFIEEINDSTDGIYYKLRFAK